MSIPSSAVGASAALTTSVDARWLMAYAAGIGDHRAEFLDPTHRRHDQADAATGEVVGGRSGVVGHPVFPVCPEWPALLAVARVPPLDALTSAERARGVHSAHDLHVHRLVRPGDVLTTVATIVGTERHRAGVVQTVRLDTTDAAGEPVATTWQRSTFLGLELDGPDVPAPAPAWPESVLEDVEPEQVVEVHRHVDRGAAHVYTECARIWNPIHTDVAVATAAGLPDLILHGTATLAMAVSAVIDAVAGGDPARVRRVTGRFAGMVLLPSDLVVRLVAGPGADGTTEVSFEVVAQSDPPVVAIRHGVVVLDAGERELDRERGAVTGS